MEERLCNGRCEMCSLNQRTYCSAQKMLFVEQDVAEIKALLIEITKNNGGEITTILTEDISAIPPAPEQEANM
ncbi:MAG: hypothetical protein IIW98_08855 [Bacteroidaceae bacterium]|nr:hypothetical protein [Bacteroidaceae bacterium]